MNAPSPPSDAAASAPPKSSFTNEGKSTGKRKIHIVIWVVGTLILLIGILVQALLNPPQQRAEREKRETSGGPKADLTRAPDSVAASEIARQREEVLKSREGKDATGPTVNRTSAKDAPAASTAIRVGPPVDQTTVSPSVPTAGRPGGAPGDRATTDPRASAYASMPPAFRDRDSPMPPGIPMQPGGPQISEAQVRALERDAPESNVARSPLEGLPSRANAVDAVSDVASALRLPVPGQAEADAAALQNPRSAEAAQLLQLAKNAMGPQRPAAVQRSEVHEQFLATSAEEKSGAVVRAQPAVSPFQLTMGAVIPAALLSELQSDLPGQILAVVTENVYDSIAGTHVVIPKGSRLVGKYSSSVANGQDRLLVAFTRITFPSGATADLSGMPGTDQGGTAGLEDKVNHHFFRQFGASILVAIIANRFTDERDRVVTSVAPGSSTVTSSILGNVLNQTVSRMLERYTNIAPTITIRRGYQFNVVVSKDMALSPNLVAASRR